MLRQGWLSPAQVGAPGRWAGGWQPARSSAPAPSFFFPLGPAAACRQQHPNVRSVPKGGCRGSLAISVMDLSA